MLDTRGVSWVSMFRTKTSWKITDPYATEQQWMSDCSDSCRDGDASVVASSQQFDGAMSSSSGFSSCLGFIHTTLALAISTLGGIATAQTIHTWNNFQNTFLEFLAPSASLWETGFFAWYNHPVAQFLMIPTFLSYFLGLARNQVKAKVALAIMACYIAIAFATYNIDGWPMSSSYTKLVFAGGAICALPMYLFGRAVGQSLERGGFRKFFGAGVIGFLYAVLFIQPTWFLDNFWLTLFTCFLIPFSSAASVTWHYRIRSFKTACALGLNAVVPFMIGLVVYAVIGLMMMAESRFAGYENWILNCIRLLAPPTLILFLGPAGGAFGALLRRLLCRRREDSSFEELSPV